MSYALKVICSLLLIMAIFTATLGGSGFNFKERIVHLANEMEVLDPFPPFPDYPELPDGDNTFFNQVGNFFRFFISTSVWLFDFSLWSIGSVFTTIRLVRIFLFGTLPQNAGSAYNGGSRGSR